MLARTRCKGRIVLFPDAEAPFVTIATGYVCAGSCRKPSFLAMVQIFGSRKEPIKIPPYSLQARSVASDPSNVCRPRILPCGKPNGCGDFRERTQGGSVDSIFARVCSCGPVAQNAFVSVPFVF